MVSLSVAVLSAVFVSLTPAGTLTLAVLEITVPELPLINRLLYRLPSCWAADSGTD